MKYKKQTMKTVKRTAAGVARTATRIVTAAIAGAAGGNRAIQATRGMINPVVKDKKKTVRRKRKVMRKPKATRQLQKQVNELSKKVNNGQGTLYFLARDTRRVLASVNQQAAAACGAVGCTQLETALAELRFFNPSAPGTLIQGSGATGTYSRNYLFDIYGKLLVRNNYQVPAKVTVYTLAPKEDTSITPVTAYANGLVDVGNPDYASQMLYLTSSPQFNELWRIVASKKMILQAGQEVEVIHSTGKFSYDPATFDSQTSEFQRKNKAFTFVVRVDGPLAHDSSADQQGFCAAGIDASWTFKYTVSYEAGVDLIYYVLSDASDSFTNGALVSSYPVADNIPYSLS